MALAFELDLEWEQFLNNSDSAMNPMTTMPSSASDAKPTPKWLESLDLDDDDDDMIEEIVNEDPPEMGPADRAL